MQMFSYKAIDAKTGEKTSAQIEAESEKAAAKVLTERGLAPLEIKPVVSGNSSGINAILGRIRTKDKVLFSRQLSTLVNAGVPLVQSLHQVSSQTANKQLKEVIDKIVIDVEGGSSLATALSRYPKVFSMVYTSMVAAGETSGTLDVSLERLANQQEKDADVIAKVRGAMIYPAIVMLAMIAVLIFMITTVLPQVKSLYNGIPGATLPLVTRALLSVSGFVTHLWWVALIVIVAVCVYGTRWAKTPKGKFTVDGLKMRMWPIGPLFMKLYMARFARTGGTLVASGVPMLEMMSVTADAVDNVHIAGAINKAAEKVKGGKSLADALEGDPNFLGLVPNMIHIGEQSGSLEDMLDKLASYYEKEVDNEIKTVSTIVEPVLMIFVGIMALIIVAAVLLPIYGLAGKSLIK
jgi:type IV pilus assembly protein PilC